jgi:hypothetical protein
LPEDWAGKSVFLEFQSVFHKTDIIINDQYIDQHPQGYTQFRVRLDNISGMQYGPNNENLLVLYVDALTSSAWWYSGGGIFSNVRLIATDPVHFAFDGVTVVPHAVGNTYDGGYVADGANVTVQVELQNDGAATAGDMFVNVQVETPQGQLQMQGAVQVAAVDGHSQPPFAKYTVELAFDVALDTVHLWSIQQPYLYTAIVTLANRDGELDQVNMTFGVRTVAFVHDKGFLLNDNTVRHTGFCDHENFAATGTALGDRIHLFRAQNLRAAGGNARRFSHNAPQTKVLDLYDRLGVVSMPEHRNFINGSVQYDAWRAMIRADRNHPSVVFFSFCNEGHCLKDIGSEVGVTIAADTMAKIAKDEAPNINTTANMTPRVNIGDEITKVIDVQGFSHQTAGVFEQYYNDPAIEGKPMVASECCSCQNDRDVTYSTPNHEGSDQASCALSQTNYSLGLPYMVGSYTWTLTDYIGEGHTFPRKSSSYGQFDLSGFPKAMAYLYRAMWLNNRNFSEPAGYGTPTVAFEPLVRIVETWDAPSSGSAIKAVTVITGGVDYVRLDVNGKATLTKCQGSHYVSIPVTYAAGSITAEGLDQNEQVVASHTMYTSPTATAMVFQLDAPAQRTGTGYGRLLNDGKDLALIRITLTDDNGIIARQASNNVTFSIVSGPGVIIGTDNGDPAGLESEVKPWHSAYHGLVRVIIRSTHVSTLSSEELARLQQVHPVSELASAGISVGNMTDPTEDIVIQASSPGLATVTLTLPTSNDVTKDGVLAVATAMSAGVQLPLE